MQITALKFKFIAAEAVSARHPLLILAHGRTGNIKLLEWYSKRFQIPELSYLLIEAPYPDQREDQKDPGFSWYLTDRKGVDESRASILKMLDEIQSQGVVATSIFWMGFSQGATMGLDLALRSPMQLGGFICVSGLCVQPETYPKAFGAFAKKQRILITHGTRDEIVSHEQAERSYAVLTKYKIPHEYKVFDKPHSFHLKSEVPLIEERLKTWISAE